MKRFIIFLTLLLLCSMAGCESGLDGTQAAVKLEPREALEEALKGLTGQSSGEFAVLLGADGTPVVPENSGIAKLLSSYVTFEIQELSSGEDSATATVDITAPDAVALIQQLIGSVDVTDAEALYASMEALLQQEVPMVSSTVEIMLQKAEDSWCVVPDFALSNAITGGLTQAYQALQQAILDQLQGGDAQ